MKRKLALMLALFLSAGTILTSTPAMAQTGEKQEQSGISLYGGSFYWPTYVSLDRTYSDNLSANEDEDYYKFTINSSGRVQIKSNAYMEYVTYRIYDENGEEVTCWWDERWNDTTQKVTLNDSVDLTKGSYYFVIEKGNGCTGNYNFKLSFTSAGESFTETGDGTNNMIESANKISLNKAYKGQIARNDDKDFYKFTLPSSGRISLKSTAYTEYLTYRVYDIDGNEIYNWDEQHWNSTTEKITTNSWLDLTKGSYYLVIEKCRGCTGNYNFKLLFTSAGESFTETGYGTNNTMESANKISLNQNYKGQIGDNDEKDFYKFTMTSSGRIYLKSQVAFENITYKIYNRNADCVWEEYYASQGFSAETCFWHSASGKHSISEGIDLKKGTYYIVAERPYGSTGNYTLGLYRYTSLSNAKVSLSKSVFTYDKKAKKPGVTVKSGSKVLKNGKDYKVSYKANKNVGTAKVVVKGIGKYNGSVTKTFTIRPTGTSLKKVIAESGAFTVYWKKHTTQTNGYQIQYARNRKFSKSRTTITCYGNQNIGQYCYYGVKAKKKYYVRVRTLKDVDGKLYCSGWSAPKSVVTKK